MATEQKTCPFCKEQINKNAIKCPFCKEFLVSKNEAEIAQLNARYSNWFQRLLVIIFGE